MSGKVFPQRHEEHKEMLCGLCVFVGNEVIKILNNLIYCLSQNGGGSIPNERRYT